ncbi:hypothetical protein [Natrinema hispanicum]|uniref:Uncharacterized protein n=1 Tax=Natrinema hispanicum TaxID=392421 RepID=A0A1I0IWF7_9EURY|nr:hypothetical protein [Natrinema hispanicum]SEU00957.1 hypothetical protein SAMN04488694_12622 [Natrinema hispanicum]
MSKSNDTQPDGGEDEEEYITKREAEQLVDEKTRDIKRKLDSIERALREK